MRDLMTGQLGSVLAEILREMGDCGYARGGLNHGEAHEQAPHGRWLLIRRQVLWVGLWLTLSPIAGVGIWG